MMHTVPGLWASRFFIFHRVVLGEKSTCPWFWLYSKTETLGTILCSKGILYLSVGGKRVSRDLKKPSFFYF